MQRKEYLKLKTNERSAISNCIDKFIKSYKGKMTADEDREDALWEEVEKKVSEREKIGKGSIRQQFPDLYDEEAERKYLRHHARVYLEGSASVGRDVDQDDDEPLLQSTCIKKELVEQSLANLHRIRALSAEYEVDQTYAAPTEREKAVVVSCVSRGFAISGDELGDDDHTNLSLTARRAWRWINGRMVVWPPFDRQTVVSGIEIKKSRKRAIDDGFDADHGASKRARR